MNHDLFLRPKAGAEPQDFDAILERILEDDALSSLVDEEASSPELLVLVDRDTGVVVTVAPGAPPLEEPPGGEPREGARGSEDGGEDEPEPEEPEDDGTLHLQLPYVRPRCFVVEGAAIAARLAALLEYALEDPLVGPGAATEARIVACWSEQNAALLAELAAPTDGAPAGDLPTPVDGKLLDAVFAHNRARRSLREAARSAEVPGLGLAALPLRKEPAVVCRHTAGEPIWLPDLATHVLLSRKKRGFLGHKDEEVLVEADALRAVLSKGARPGVAPQGLTAYEATLGATAPEFAALQGPPGKGLALYPWSAVTDAPAA